MRCSPRLVDREARISLSAAARQRRPLPAARSARGRRLSPPRHDDRRCRRRGVRQGGEAARPRLSRRPGDRGAGAGRRSARPCRCRARWSAPGSRISASPASRAAVQRAVASRRASAGGYRRQLPAGGGRLLRRPHQARARQHRDAPSLVVAGGVAANAAVRAALKQLGRGQRPPLLAFRRAGCAPTMRR